LLNFTDEIVAAARALDLVEIDSVLIEPIKRGSYQDATNDIGRKAAVWSACVPHGLKSRMVEDCPSVRSEHPSSIEINIESTDDVWWFGQNQDNTILEWRIYRRYWFAPAAKRQKTVYGKGRPPLTDYFWSFFPAIADYNPAEFWRRVTVPALVVEAGKDERVPVDASVQGIRAALTQAGNADYTIVVFPSAPHTFFEQAPPGEKYRSPPAAARDIKTTESHRSFLCFYSPRAGLRSSMRLH
jgi:pimeloyl-ACP methyl ester carboxylesterase